jgi:dTDP-4-amino-4,6-dideoxy-D-galactose acyltransferase
MKIKQLQWDSDFFGYPIGEIELSKSGENNPKESEFKLLIGKCSPDDSSSIELLSRIGKRVDCKRTYLFNITKSASQLENQSLIKEFSGQYEDLLDLAYESGRLSRFKTDNHFHNNEFERLYSRWVEKAVCSEESKVFIAQNNGIQGFVTLDFQVEFAKIGLIAVSANARGSGLGKKLIEACITTCAGKGFSKLIVATQKDNIVACRLYESVGFQLNKEENIYHIWNYEVDNPFQ